MLNFSNLPERPSYSLPLIASLPPAAAVALESAGVIFQDEETYDSPGPVRWARFAVQDGVEIGAIHHFAHPSPFVELRASREDGRRSVKRLVALLGLDEGCVQYF